MNASKTSGLDTEFESFLKLVQAMRKDPVINKKVVHILKMESYLRRLVLNNWLEKLRKENAPKKLTQTLSYLFDDIVAEKTLKLIK